VGWRDVEIFVSGDLDENRIQTLVRQGAPVNAFGVGTALSTSADAPNVGVIYKLVEIEIDEEVRGTAKFSADKETHPGRKQIFRFSDEEGKNSGDIIGLEEESFPSAESLLIPVMREGRRSEAARQNPATAVATARERFLASRARVPEPILSLTAADRPYPVSASARLKASSDEARQSLLGAAHD
jgi:nicotinate phosphoribosyltransferase